MKVSIGTWLTIPDLRNAEVLCLSNLDWITIDIEHNSISYEQVENIIRIANLYNKKVYVRISSINEVDIKKVLDAGADGLIIPNVKTKSEVDKIINFAFYPPIGSRGVGLSRANNFGKNFDKYFLKKSKTIKIIVQIEHFEAVHNIEEILANKNINGFFIGPYDLSASLGVPGKFNSQIYKKYESIIKNFMKNKKMIKGVHVIEPDLNEIKKKKNDGFNFIAYSLDFKMIMNSLEKIKN
jgi:2-dehydro-3-deoxyglucarate aldolase